jgi:hypothetical protein
VVPAEPATELIPGVPGVRIFWLFFGIFFVGVMLIFQRLRFFANLW